MILGLVWAFFGKKGVFFVFQFQFVYVSKLRDNCGHTRASRSKLSCVTAGALSCIFGP